MTDRIPLQPITDEAKRVEALKQVGLDANLIPLDASALERAAEYAPPYKEKHMDTVKPGWQTSEFWLHALVTLVVLPLMAWFASDSGPLSGMLDALKGLNPVFALVIPLAKTPLFAFLAWLATKLSTSYSAGRVEQKIAALEASK